MRPVIVRNVKIGEGKPKICIPIVGNTREAILAEAHSLLSLPVDVVEWRADWYEDVFYPEKILDTARELRHILGEIPLLFTFRTAKEGGEKAIDHETYLALNKTMIGSGFIDLVDVEIFTGDTLVASLIEEAHRCGIAVVASNHDFHKTPSEEEITKRLIKMKDMGADIPKIAVMPTCKKDVLTLLAATVFMEEHYPDTPVITMSMAGTGVVSRLIGEFSGSALTFGAAKKVSAPGQIPAQDLVQVLDIIHQNS